MKLRPKPPLACNRLADAGIPLGCQTVLLKGVNDDLKVMGTLMRKLLTIRVINPIISFMGIQPGEQATSGLR